MSCDCHCCLLQPLDCPACHSFAIATLNAETSLHSSDLWAETPWSKHSGVVKQLQVSMWQPMGFPGDLKLGPCITLAISSYMNFQSVFTFACAPIPHNFSQQTCHPMSKCTNKPLLQLVAHIFTQARHLFIRNPQLIMLIVAITTCTKAMEACEGRAVPNYSKANPNAKL